MNEQRHVEVGALLIDLECTLRRLDLWQTEAPSEAALASREPFCIDTLELHQWLQFIFLPRMQRLVERRLPLPTACGIAPLAEEVYQRESDAMAPLLRELQRLDQALSGEE